ncbi:MAG: MBL fold metallo-hydrolase [Betaproteobacteria bacterium RBG_16_64_9]|nr:MAG: MBL fold metallo-hydrolase [Betaproteobacteria bacterium RBG_16_64_9]
MKVAILPVTPFQQNCFLLVDETTNKAALVDPGGDLDHVLAAVKQSGAELEKIFITHGHVDHCGGTAELRKRTGLPVEGPHEEDGFWIEQIAESGMRFGMGRLEPFVPDRWLQGGDTVTFGNVTLQVRHCPGHTPGHVIFYCENDRLAIVGDVLFQGSIGRTDIPRGDYDALIRSITTQLWPLGSDVTFIPGHGPVSTFGEERETNSFVSDRALAGMNHRGEALGT